MKDYCDKCGSIFMRARRERRREETDKLIPGTIGYYKSLTAYLEPVCECNINIAIQDKKRFKKPGRARSRKFY